MFELCSNQTFRTFTMKTFTNNHKMNLLFIQIFLLLSCTVSCNFILLFPVLESSNSCTILSQKSVNEEKRKKKYVRNDDEKNNCFEWKKTQINKGRKRKKSKSQCFFFLNLKHNKNEGEERKKTWNTEVKNTKFSIWNPIVTNESQNKNKLK